MKAAKAWCLAGLVVMAGVSSVSCGEDEVPKGDDNGTVIGGAGGADDGGGNPGRAGGGGTVGSAATKLGQACVNDSQCVDPKAPGLTCVTAKDTVLGDGAPPKGLCTATCSGDEECTALGAGAICYPFDATSSTGYCVEGCSFGTPDIGAPQKCHDRQEFACNPALVAPTSTSCTSAGDCQAGELCISGACNVVFPACLPGCRGDIDCEAGMYCDQAFLSGVCVAKKPTGKALGEPCTVPGDNEPSEPDECLGFCQADATGSTKGHCSTTCGLTQQCAWNSGTSKFDGMCFYASALTADTGGVGDFGFCTPTCNCTDECNDPKLACALLSQGELPAELRVRGPGLCFSPDAMTKEYNQCDTSGAGGGSGGASAGGAGGATESPASGGAGGADATPMGGTAG